MLYHNTFAPLFKKLTDLTLVDEIRLKKKLTFLSKQNVLENTELVAWEEQLEQAKQHYQNRVKCIPKIRYDDTHLPVFLQKDILLDSIQKHQIIIIAGETGSGKTTQLPKICLEIGRGRRGFIGHTQPRRIAARSVAKRIAHELRTEVGQVVGYKVRFSDNVGVDSAIKLMTDGILLAEIQQDPLLTYYDTLIIDEAHERSLNIDFILGYLKQILPKRPDLKIIITSATLDLDRLSDHFAKAPVIKISGRTYPVEIRYRHEIDVRRQDQVNGIINAVHELGNIDPGGDILIFLSGEREITDAAEALIGQKLTRTEILPLYARLSNREQNRIFQAHSDRRIVLATNVAETSLTVPGIRYIIDTGFARISRYNAKTKVQHLPIEAISKASANQRAGRCGRTSAGICIRLYEESDYENRLQYTDPEILRTNLASVILQMTALRLGDINNFPFIDAPNKRYIQDGIRLLQELGALEWSSQKLTLTKTGRQLAHFSVDPRLGRMILEASKLGCLHEIIRIVAGLSIQDPCERWKQKQQNANEKHKRFTHERSDFLRFLKLWDYIENAQRKLTSNQFRKFCQQEYLNYLRVREWQDLVTQLCRSVAEAGFQLNEIPGDYSSIHRSILSGLLSHIGFKKAGSQCYSGIHNIHFHLQPNSVLFNSPPKWCVVHELIETSRLWGCCAAIIDPDWLESLGKNLTKRSYSAPHWSKKQNAVLAYEKVTLFGLPIVEKRLVNYHKIDPVLSRELFIRCALVAGDWYKTTVSFYQHNKKLIECIEKLEDKSRCRNILVEPEYLFDFYHTRIPAHVISAQEFDRWWKSFQKDHPDYLNFTEDLLIRQGTRKGISADDFPDVWQSGKVKLDVNYVFDPSSKQDGVTIIIPITLLNQIDAWMFDWQVPGLRYDLVLALIKSLPKKLRRHLSPASQYATAFLERTESCSCPLIEALSTEFRQMTGVTIAKQEWDYDKIPDYLRINFHVVDEEGKLIFSGRDFYLLKKSLTEKIAEHIARSEKACGLEKEHLTTWNFGDLPKEFENKKKSCTVTVYPALISHQSYVNLRLVTSKKEQCVRSLIGLRTLIILNLVSPVQYLHEILSNKSKLALYFSPFGSVRELIDDCIAAAVDTLIRKEGGMVWTEKDFIRLLSGIKREINIFVGAIIEKVQYLLTLYFQINKRLKGYINLSLSFSIADIKKQLSKLIYKRFVATSGTDHLDDIIRYLNAIQIRLDKLGQNLNKDRVITRQINQLENIYENVVKSLSEIERTEQQIVMGHWMLEELRVNLFAQQIKTPYPISEKRVRDYFKKLNKITNNNRA